MAQIFYVILSLSISGGLIGLLILLIRPATRRFFAKKWTYYLWLLVLARLMVPIHVDINVMEHLSVKLSEMVSRQENEKDGSGDMISDGTAGEKYAGAVLDTADAGDMVNTENTQEVLDEEGYKSVENIKDQKEKAGPAGTDIRFYVFYLAGILWLLGVFLSAMWRLYAYHSFSRKICASCVPVTDEKVQAKVVEIQTRLRIGRRVPLYESVAVGSPMLIGLKKPYIVLPSKLLGEMTGRENDICLILHHELVHYKRRDIWYKWLFQAVLCIHWFNPLVYLFNRKFNVDCELACDEKVMALLTEEGRKAYGDVLLDVAETRLPGSSFAGHKYVPAMTLLEEKLTLKERLRGIARYHKNGFAVGLCSLTVLAVLVIMAILCGAAGSRFDSGKTNILKNGGVIAKGLDDITDASFEMNQPMIVNNSGNAYQMYDDDALIAGECEHDFWHAKMYKGGGKSIDVQRFLLNGSDILWIIYANKDTTVEITSTFTLREGRFKIVQVMPDGTVQTINESGEKTTDILSLSEGRNCFKVVGQKARLEDLTVGYSSLEERDINGIYRSEEEEYAHQVKDGLEPLDLSRLEEIYPYLEAEEVSRLCQYVWETDAVLSDENWQDLFVYSDTTLTAQYLLEALEADRIKEFDSRILAMIDYAMNEKDVSACFQYLLKRGKILESDWESIFTYSDPDLSAEYLLEAMREGTMDDFNEKILEQINFRISSEALTDIVLEMDKDALTFDSLCDDVMPYLGDEQRARCIFHYIDLGNLLTDTQLEDIRVYVSEKDFYRIIEYNGKRK